MAIVKLRLRINNEKNIAKQNVFEAWAEKKPY